MNTINFNTSHIEFRDEDGGVAINRAGTWIVSSDGQYTSTVENYNRPYFGGMGVFVYVDPAISDALVLQVPNGKFTFKFNNDQLEVTRRGQLTTIKESTTTTVSEFVNSFSDELDRVRINHRTHYDGEINTVEEPCYLKDSGAPAKDWVDEDEIDEEDEDDSGELTDKFCNALERKLPNIEFVAGCDDFTIGNLRVSVDADGNYVAKFEIVIED